MFKTQFTIETETRLSTEGKKFRRALVIGLGGSGQKVLINLKRMLIDAYGQVPPCIQLLCFDTTGTQEKAYSLRQGAGVAFSPNEFIHLKSVNPVSFIEQADLVNKWFIPMEVGAIVNGACGVRQIGRIGLHVNMKRVHTAIQNALNAIMDQKLIDQMARTDWAIDKDKELEVFITSSIAGGTGSGTFIDVGMMCRALCPTAVITGYFVLPWIYTQFPATSRVGPNAYAALKELEYLMSMDISDTKSFSFDFGAFRSSITKPPFDIFHLVDGRNINGICVRDPVVLATVISEGLFMTLGAVGDVSGDITVNLLKLLGSVPREIWDGKIARFTSLGAARLYFPAEELFFKKCFEDILALLDQLSRKTDEDAVVPSSSNAEVCDTVRSFLVDNGLQFNTQNSFEKKIIPIDDLELSIAMSATIPFSKDRLVPALESKASFKEDDMKDAIKKGVSTSGDAKNALLAAIGKLELETNANEKAGSRALGFTRDILMLLHHELTALQKSYETGITDCQKVINETKSHKDQLANQIKSIRPFFGKGQMQRAAQDYIETINSAHNASIRIELYRLCIKVLDACLDYCSTVSSKYMKGENIKELQKRVIAEIRDQARFHLRGIEEKMHTMKDDVFVRVIEPHDKETVELLKAHEFSLSEFLKDRSPSAFLSQPVGAISDELFAFVSAKNKWIFSRDICKVLESFGDEEYKACINRALQLSVPMIKFDKGYLTPQRQEHIIPVSIVGLPSGEHFALNKSKIGRFIEELRNDYELTYTPQYAGTHDPFSINILNFYAAVPAFVLDNMQEYLQRYEETLNPTCHIGVDYEFITEDLFPEKQLSSMALKILSFAIMPEFGCIKDEKKERGHLYTLRKDLLDEEDPRQYLRFIDILDDVRSDDDLLEALKKHLIEFSEEIEEKGKNLKKISETIVGPYLKKIKLRLKSRDFSKMISARLFAREARYLQEYLNAVEANKKMKKGDANVVTLKKFLLR